MKNTKSKLILTSAAAIVLQLVAPSFIEVAHAANAPQFTEMFVRLDRHKALTPTGATVCAKPSAASTTGTEASVVVTFPTLNTTGGETDFAVNATAANWVVDSTDLAAEPGTSTPVATFWPGMTSGTTAATSVSGHTVTFPSGDLTAGTLYCFHISGTNTLTTSAAIAPSKIVGATAYTKDNTTNIINQTNWSTSIITDDQIAVSAVVPPNFSISLSANADAFTTNLDPANPVPTTGVDVSVSTNAVGGWITWVKDSQQGLYSATANYKINTTGTVDDTPETLVANTEGYGMIGSLTTSNTGGCTPAIAAEYAGVSATPTVGKLAAGFQPVAACKRLAATPGTSDGDVFKLKEYATIRGGTPAGSDYSDIITVVGAGNF